MKKILLIVCTFSLMLSNECNDIVVLEMNNKEKTRLEFKIKKY